MGRVLIAGTNSGSGKTTIVCGILQAFVNRGLKTGSFKCGPDYIDPMFHSEIIGTKSRNLDGFFMDKQTMRYLLAQNSKGNDISVIEGVMGYYDGFGMTETASSYQVAKDTETPAILVIPCKGMSRSACAVLSGFINFKKASGIKGVIFNQLSPKLYPEIADFCHECGIRPLGYFPMVKEAKLESRHLGLVTAQEIADLKEKVNRLGETVEQYIDLDGILEIAQSAKQYEIAEKKELCDTKQLRIAVARDKAFCFYYEDNLDLLRQLGCELVEFSPLQEKQLPANIDGLLLGGGYPELYGQQLSANQSLLCELRAAIKNGLPTHAECGGYMYLHETMTDVEGNVYRMAGVLKGSCHFTEQLQHFGYVTLKACTDNLLCEKGCELRAHEFHRCVSDVEQTVFDAVKGNKHWKSYVAGDNLAAGFTHIHYYANPAVAERFVEYCRKYHVKRNEQ